jgi:hypothetical protein
MVADMGIQDNIDWALSCLKEYLEAEMLHLPRRAAAARELPHQ